MKNKLNEELKDIKYLFNYNRGRVISEQDKFDDQEEFVNYDNINYDDEEEFVDYDDLDDDRHDWKKTMDDMDMGDTEEFVKYDDMELDEEMDLPVMLPGTIEKERTNVTPGTKPKTPSTPYKPKPGPKPDPKARKRKGDMPTWLTFDELGIDFE